ncbi:uncharacterized protein [Drosophila tropicalis]|uniref:uncharacterized protein n=1 Tax=Drosophila tropicalis TaxID=46794 RepID=UPI0035AB72CB
MVGMEPLAAMQLSSAIRRLEELATSLTLRNALLEGAASKPAAQPPTTPVAAPVAMHTAAYHAAFPAVTARAAPVVPVPGVPVAASRFSKSAETWSAVVTSRDPNVSSKQMAERVIKEVASTLGMRENEVRVLRSGRAVIRTPSVGELRRVVANKKFAEVGLNVRQNKAAKPSLRVIGVHMKHTPEGFMKQLYEGNFNKMTVESFKKAVHIVSKPWTAQEDKRVNVTIEVDDSIAALLEGSDRFYIEWFSYRFQWIVRTHVCHKCASYDHKVSKCGAMEDTCFRCGQKGHKVRKCDNPVDWRNCRFKGRPSLLCIAAGAPHRPGWPNNWNPNRDENFRQSDLQGTPKKFSAVIIDDPDAICLPVESLITEAGVCVRITGIFGSIYLISLFCHAHAELTSVFQYMDTILLLVGSTPLILCLDSNAISPMWFSKRYDSYRGQLNYRRGEQLEDWILAIRAGIVNRFSEVYTFDNRRGQSDIDVTIVSEAASTWAAYDWSVDEWEMSDHNIITVVVTPSPDTVESTFAPVPSWKLRNANWRLFDSVLVEEIREHLPLEHIRMSPLDSSVSALCLAVQSTCDRVLVRRTSRAAGKVKWWTTELSTKRHEVRRLRRRFQNSEGKNLRSFWQLICGRLSASSRISS